LLSPTGRNLPLLNRQVVADRRAYRGCPPDGFRGGDFGKVIHSRRIYSFLDPLFYLF
jgi:hypothetical protein